VELKQLITQFTYRIEPKPEGGFVAHASDPTVPPLEAATREELRQKIQATIRENLAAQFPALKPALEGQKTNFAFHIEHQPGGGFVVQSTQAQPIAIGSHQDLESQFAGKFASFVGNHLAGRLAEQIAGQASSGDLKVSLTPKIRFTVKTGSHTLNLGDKCTPPAAATQLDGKEIEDPETLSSPTNASVAARVSNAPITPESSSSWTMLLFVLFLLSIGAIVYFLIHYR
jgi:hypothetical protein